MAYGRRSVSQTTDRSPFIICIDDDDYKQTLKNIDPKIKYLKKFDLSFNNLSNTLAWNCIYKNIQHRNIFSSLPTLATPYECNEKKRFLHWLTMLRDPLDALWEEKSLIIFDKPSKRPLSWNTLENPLFKKVTRCKLRMTFPISFWALGNVN